MALSPGARLGPYEVLSALGAGGMGEVYKACDTRLDRTVAIKVLPSEVAGDPQLRERFDREARVISHLTHPHICTLYDVGDHNGMAFLVMELLERRNARRSDRAGRIERSGPAARGGADDRDPDCRCPDSRTSCWRGASRSQTGERRAH